MPACRDGSSRVRSAASFALMLALALVPALMAACGSSGDDDRVAVAPAGQTAFEFIGAVSQNGPDFSFSGYVTRVRGLESADLFSDPANHSEATARITIFGAGKMTDRSILQNLFDLSTEATLSIYYSATPAGASFDNPQSFAQGETIAVVNLKFQHLITVIAPDTGMASGQGDMTLSDTRKFSIGDKGVTFGRDDEVVHIVTNGFGKRLEPTAPQATVLLSGTAVGTSD